MVLARLAGSLKTRPSSTEERTRRDGSQPARDRARDRGVLDRTSRPRPASAIHVRAEADPAGEPDQAGTYAALVQDDRALRANRAAPGTAALDLAPLDLDSDDRHDGPRV